SPHFDFFRQGIDHGFHSLQRGRKVEVAIVTGFSAERNVDIEA
ncbi:MAG: hypothetical protein RJA19_1191, partial [Bacteroidota bacterium]